jgi:hypothetical protein
MPELHVDFLGGVVSTAADGLKDHSGLSIAFMQMYVFELDGIVLDAFKKLRLVRGQLPIEQMHWQYVLNPNQDIPRLRELLMEHLYSLGDILGSAGKAGERADEALRSFRIGTGQEQSSHPKPHVLIRHC